MSTLRSKRITPVQDRAGVQIGSAPQRSDANDHPAFTFHLCVKGYRIVDLTEAQRARALDELRKRSDLTWGSIRAQDPKALNTHTVPASRFQDKSVANAVPSDKAIDVFHCGGKSRIIGYRGEGCIFHVVAFDPTGKAYPHD